jgi:hypothetical protein
LGDGRVQFGRSVSEPTDQNYYTTRIDHSLSSSDSIFVRYTFDQAILQNIASINMITNERTRNQFLTIQYDRILSPTLLNTFNVGYSRTNTSSVSDMISGFQRFTFTD